MQESLLQLLLLLRWSTFLPILPLLEMTRQHQLSQIALNLKLLSEVLELAMGTNHGKNLLKLALDQLVWLHFTLNLLLE